MRRWALVGLLALPLAASADEPLVIKGLAIGMPRAAVIEAMPQLDCAGTPDICFVRPATGCREANKGGSDTFLACLTPYYYGGRLAIAWGVRFRDEKLVSVYVTIGERQFDEVAKALLLRFGKPARDESSAIQNRMGAQFEQRVLSWIRGGVTLLATRRAGNIDQSSVTLMDNAWAMQQKEERQRSAKDRAKDM